MGLLHNKIGVKVKHKHGVKLGVKVGAAVGVGLLRAQAAIIGHPVSKLIMYSELDLVGLTFASTVEM